MELQIPTKLEQSSFTVLPSLILDWNKDGNPDLISVVRTTHSYQPRSILINSLVDGKTLLFEQVGPLIESIIAADIDKDGKEEIIFGGKAPNNCENFPPSQRFFNDTDDTQSWLFIIDDTGEFLIKKQISGFVSATSPLVCDLNHDGNYEIVLLTVEGLAGKSSSVAFLDLASQQLTKERKRPVQISLSSGTFDWQEDGQDEFLILWKDGLLEVRNANNDIVTSVESGIQNSSRLQVVDIEEDGSKEILINSSSEIMMLDAHLNPLLHEVQAVDKVNLVSAGFGQKKLVSIVSGNNLVVYELRKNLSQFIYKPSIAFAAFFIGLALGISLMFSIRAKRNKNFFIPTEAPSNVMFLILKSNGAVKRMGKNVEKFFDLPHSRNIPLERIFRELKWNQTRELITKTLDSRASLQNHEIVVNDAGHQNHFILNLSPVSKGLFRSHTYLMSLQDTTDLVRSKRAVAWASLAQRLAHEIKTPLSSVMLAAQQLQNKIGTDAKKFEKLRKYLDYIINQVYRLRSTTDAFMKFAHIQAPNLQPTNLNQTIEHCINELSEIISPKIKIRREFGEDVPTMLIDRDQMQIAVKNILENGVNAMESEGVLIVTTRLVQSLQKEALAENNVTIEIADTGRGIPEDQLHQVFEPFFSCAEGGTGLGLTLVKKIVEDHGGTISIKSEVDIGTTFTMTLPIQQGE